MPRCASCVADIPESSRFCPQCGQPSGGLDGSGSLFFSLTLFLLRVLPRKQWLAAMVWVLGWAGVGVLRGNPGPFPESLYVAALYGLIYSLLVVILLRLGFFALVVSTFVLDSMSRSFFTTVSLPGTV